MTEPTGIHRQAIRFVIGDLGTVFRTVTKTTTCDDVINSLPPQREQLAVYESLNGVEKELSGKTRILKVWRTHGVKSSVDFFIRKADDFKGSRTSRTNLRAKLGALSRRLSRTNIRDRGNKTGVTSTSSLCKSDSSLTNTDKKDLSRYSSVDSRSISEQLQLQHSTRRPTLTEVTNAMSGNNARVVGDSLKTMILGFKKTTSSNATTQRRQHSTSVSGTEDYPLHSTPVVPGSGRSKRCTVVQLSSTPNTQRTGRPSRFYDGDKWKNTGVRHRELMSSTLKHNQSRDTLSRVSGQFQRYRYSCDENGDSDSDSSFDGATSCAGSELDVAFCDPCTPDLPRPRPIGCDYVGSVTTTLGGLDHSSDCSFPPKTGCYQAGLYGYGSDGERSGAESDDGWWSASGTRSSYRILTFV
ncbi:MAG: hypothetical protein ABW185_28210 [Sedimenticola sp.]